MSEEKQIPLKQVFTETVAKMLKKIGLDRQLMVDLETYRLYVHDGKTPGGHPLRKMSDPTSEIRNIPFKGPDPKKGETWVLGEWPSDENESVMVAAYVAGAVGKEPEVLLDSDIEDNESEKSGQVTPKQLHSLKTKLIADAEMVWEGSLTVVYGLPKGLYVAACGDNGSKGRVEFFAVGFEVPIGGDDDYFYKYYSDRIKVGKDYFKNGLGVIGGYSPGRTDSVSYISQYSGRTMYRIWRLSK